MARRRKTDEPDAAVGVADPPLTDHPPPGEQPPSGAPTDGLPASSAPPNRPAATFAAYSDRTTRIELACWQRVVKAGDGEEYTQYALTVSRSWRGREGTWAESTSYRVHDIPVLLCLVTQAYQWCIAQRTQVRATADGTATS